KVGFHVAGGGGNRDDFEHAVEYGVGHIVLVGGDQDGDGDQADRANHRQVKIEFRITEVDPGVALTQGHEVQRKTHGAGQHEQDGNQVDGGAVEVAETGVVGGEAA